MKKISSTKRTLAMLAALLMILTMVPTLSLAAGDYTGHWAESSIAKAVENGWFVDGNNTRPDASITRAEFVTMVNRLKGFTGEGDLSAFSDVKAGDWYYDAFAVAVAQDYIHGSNGKLNPDAYITRNEAAAIFARVSGLDTTADYSAFLTGVKDSGVIPTWAEVYVGATVANGLMAGSNGNFNGNSDITRAETAVLLERLYDDIRTYGFAGTYTGNAAGVVVSSAGVTLQDMNISGDLTISELVGDGEVTLDTVDIGGQLDVRGGGMNSVYIKNSKISSIVVTKDEVRVVFQDGTTATYANIEGSNSAIVIGNGAKIDNIVIEADAVGAALQIESGAKVATVTVIAPESSVNLASGAAITTLNVTETATGTAVVMETGSKVTTANIEAKTEVSGTGKIETANIKAEEVVIETPPAKIKIDEGIVVEIGGEDKTSKDNTSETTAPPSGGTPSEEIPSSQSNLYPTVSLTTTGESIASTRSGDTYTFDLTTTNARLVGLSISDAPSITINGGAVTVAQLNDLFNSFATSDSVSAATLRAMGYNVKLVMTFTKSGYLATTVTVVFNLGFSGNVVDISSLAQFGDDLFYTLSNAGSNAFNAKITATGLVSAKYATALEFANALAAIVPGTVINYVGTDYALANQGIELATAICSAKGKTFETLSFADLNGVVITVKNGSNNQTVTFVAP